VSFEKIKKYIPAPTKNGAFHSHTKSEKFIINLEILEIRFSMDLILKVYFYCRTIQNILHENLECLDQLKHL
jgi:hypothetical protein